jgi:hypothetical protein
MKTFSRETKDALAFGVFLITTPWIFYIVGEVLQ